MKTTSSRRSLSLKKGNYVTKTDYAKLAQRIVNVSVEMNNRRTGIEEIRNEYLVSESMHNITIHLSVPIEVRFR